MMKETDIHKEVLGEIVERIRGLLYLDLTPEVEHEGDNFEEAREAGIKPNSEFWNPKKLWTPDTLQDIAEVLAMYDLVPKNVEPH